MLKLLKNKHISATKRKVPQMVSLSHFSNFVGCWGTCIMEWSWTLSREMPRTNPQETSGTGHVWTGSSLISWQNRCQTRNKLQDRRQQSLSLVGQIFGSSTEIASYLPPDSGWWLWWYDLWWGCFPAQFLSWATVQIGIQDVKGWKKPK